MRNILLLSFLLMLTAVSACGGEEAVPTAVPLTNVPAETAVTGTDAAAPTAVATATSLAAPPTLPPVPTSTAVAAPTLELSGLVLDSPEDFGDNRNPLTGEEVDPANLGQRPLAVKLSNAPAIYTRPQSGLNAADFVYEHTTEGSITRFTAIFYGKMPPRIGPVRSARLIDLELPAMYDAALAFSGSSAGVGERLNQIDFADRLIYGWETGFYRTGEDKPFEHTLYADPELLHQNLEAKGLNTPPDFNGMLTFSSEPLPGGQPASEAAIDYIWTFVEWKYDEGDGRYYRWADSVPHNDGNTGRQVNAANVVYLAPFHVEDPTICEQIANGVCVALSVQVQLWGSGNAILFRDGQYYEVIWHREGRNDLLTFTDQAGNPFPLQIGNTWVQVVPSWLDDPLTVTP